MVIGRGKASAGRAALEIYAPDPSSLSNTDFCACSPFSVSGYLFPYSWYLLLYLTSTNLARQHLGTTDAQIDLSRGWKPACRHPQLRQCDIIVDGCFLKPLPFSYQGGLPSALGFSEPYFIYSDKKAGRY